MAGGTTVIEIVVQVADNTASGAKSATSNISKLEKSLERTQKQLERLKGKSKLEMKAELKDMASKGIQKVLTSGQKIAGKVWKVTLKAKDMVTAPFKKIMGLLSNPITQAVTFAGVSLGTASTINTFKDFESAMASAAATAGIDKLSDDYKKMESAARAAGASTTKTAAESANALEYMALAGWDVDTSIKALPKILRLSEATEMDLGRTSDLVTDSMANLGLTVNELPTFLDKVTKAQNASNQSAGQLLEAYLGVGGQFKRLGIETTESATALGVMANRGLKGSEAATALNAILINLTTGTGAAGKMMEKLGVSAYDDKGKFIGLQNVLKKVNNSLEGLTDEEKDAAMAAIGGKVHVDALEKLLAGLNTTNAEGIVEWDALAKSIDNSAGSLDRMADIKTDTLAGSLEKLQSAVAEMQISLGSKLEPYVRGFVDWLTACVPGVGNTIGGALDFINQKIKEVTGNGNVENALDNVINSNNKAAWESANVWGKIKIAWNKIIAEPFSTWWSGTGKSLFVEKAGEIGNGLGTVLKDSILGLLGLDIGGAVEDGVNIGKSFADGFLKGFDVGKVAKGLLDALKNVFKDAATLLPGGTKASGTSGLSAALLGVGAFKIGQTGYKLFKDGKSIFDKGRGIFGTIRGLLGKDKGSGKSAGDLSKIFGAKQTTATMNVQAGIVNITSGMKGMASGGNSPVSLLKTGGNASTRAGGAAVAGGIAATAAKIAGVGGAITAGLSLISAAKDFYTGYKTKNQEERRANVKAGLWKGGGVAAGAAIGAGIGSFIPVIGTLVGAGIGAGIGGLTGVHFGNRAKSNYYAAEKAKANASSLAEAQAKYGSQELKDALADTSVTAEDFAKMLEKAAQADISKHFGKIALSASEIADVASRLVDIGDANAVSDFSNATANKQSAYQSLGSHISNLDKLNWKIGLGLKLNESERGAWEQELNGIYDSVKEYLENTHYEATTAIKLLVGPESEFDFTGLDSVYENLNQQLNDLGTEYKANIELALEDGVITLDEQAEIQNLQDQIIAITNEVSDIETTANLKALQIKYSGAALDADSFSAMQTELESQVEQATAHYDDALKVGIASLELQLSEGAINQEQYDTQLQALSDGYDAKIHDLQVSVESFQLQNIADAYSKDLEGILPDIEGSTAEKLKTAISNALANGVDVTAWDTETASKWLGIGSLEKETQTAITGLISSVAKTFPNDMKTEIAAGFENANIGGSIGEKLPSSIENTDLSSAESATNKLKSDLKNMVEGKFKDSIDVNATVRVNTNYIYANSAPTGLSGANYRPKTGGGYRGRDSYGFAAGTNYAPPGWAWVGEEGPELMHMRGGETILPAGISREFAFGSGGIVGSIGNLVADNPNNSRESREFSSDDRQSGQQERTSGGVSPIQIQLEVNPQIVIQTGQSGGNRLEEEAIVAIIRAHIREMADDIGDELAERLVRIFENMPLRGGR